MRLVRTLAQSPWGRIGVAFVVYLALTLVLFAPLVPRMGSAVPHDLGDPLLSAWILWWNAHHLPLTSVWWDGLSFYPMHGSLALSDHRIGLGLIATPVQWLGGGPILAHNIVLLLSFPLCAAAAHAFARSIANSEAAGAIAGVSFGFNPYRMAHIAHLELLAAWWLPLVLLALHRQNDDGQRRWTAVFAACLALQGLSCGYYFFFAAPLLLLWTVWFVRSPQIVVRIALGCCAAFAVLLPVLLGYREVLGQQNLARTFTEVASFGADVMGLMGATPLLAFWRSPEYAGGGEGQIFPGTVVVALVVAALVARPAVPRAPSRFTPRRMLHVVLLISALVFEAVSLSTAFGGWSVRIGGAMLSAHEASRPASIALVFVLLAIATSDAFVDASRRRSALAFYTSMAVLMYLLALGPIPRMLGERALYRGPYAWLMALPGFGAAFRVPARFAMLMALTLSVAAALAFARVTSRTRPRVRNALALLFAVGVLADGWIVGLPVLDPPASWRWPADAPANAAVLELPIGGDMEEIAAVWRTLFHQHPAVNGYSGYEPWHHLLLRLALGRGDYSAATSLAEYGPILFAIDRRDERANEAVAAISRAHAVALGRAEDRDLLLLRGVPTPPAPHGSRLAVARASANFGDFPLESLIDGDPTTKWLTQGPQRGGEEIAVDLAHPARVYEVVISLGSVPGDYPRQLQIETSMDRQAWVLASDAPTGGAAVLAFLRNPADGRMRFRLPGSEAMFIRLRQTGSDANDYWSVAELEIIGEPK